ncbi:MAG: PorV/PorQ family protein [Bacteroidota bacterium]
MKTIVFVLLLSLLGGGIAAAQTFKSDVSKKGTTAASFLSISQGARAASMGSAFVAVADDWSALYWNPAGIASLGNGVMFDHTLWLADIGYNFIGGSVNLGSFGSLGMSVTSSSIGDMRVTTVTQPDGTGEVFNVSQVAFGLTYALKLTDDFAIGFTPKYVYERIYKMDASALAIDVGVKYATPFKGIILGMSISNFGQKMHMTGQNAIVLYDSDPSNSGNNGRIPAELTTDEWSLPLNFRVGVAYHPDLGEMHKITLAVDALHPSDDYESVNVGGEYTFDDIISFRGGYKALFLKDSEESFTLGVGVKQRLLGNITLIADYSYLDFGRLTSVHKITVGMGF